jgi:glucosamine--fructose-6-phosphate aminotransferase (isomerizing)
VTAVAAPSVITMYRARLAWDEALVLAISQSGESPDVVATIEQARDGGALTVALVNQARSPLAAAAEVVLPLHAGPEISVAATKSYIASLVALARLVSVWKEDQDLLDKIGHLPEMLKGAAELEWSPAWQSLSGAANLLVLARGYSFPIALEAALKMKETCGLHAEAFSGAEVRHGPIALVNPGLPVLVFAPAGPTMQSTLSLAAELAASRGPRASEGTATPGTRVFVASPGEAPGVCTLPVADTLDPVLDPIALVQSFYRFSERLARARGYDPDRPAALSKVTRTL